MKRVHVSSSFTVQFLYPCNTDMETFISKVKAKPETYTLVEKGDLKSSALGMPEDVDALDPITLGGASHVSGSFYNVRRLQTSEVLNCTTNA